METTTQLKEAPAAAPAAAPSTIPASQAIVTVQGNSSIAPIAEWTTERVQLMKRTIAPPGANVTDDEFAVFLEQCKRTGMDPLIKECYLVPRRAKVGDNWVERYEFQAAAGGMLARAERYADYRGYRSGVVHKHDRCTIDQAAGTVQHTWEPGHRGEVIGAWAIVYREGRNASVVWVDFDAYVQRTNKGEPTKFWATIPDTMIEKCALAAALRKAFPSSFGTIYIPEEMLSGVEDDGGGRRVEYDRGQQPPQPGGKVAAMKEKLRQQQAKAGTPSLDPIKFVVFGSFRGRDIASLNSNELTAAILAGKEAAGKSTGNEPWAPRLAANLDALRDEERVRAQQAAQAKAAPVANTNQPNEKTSPVAVPRTDSGRAATFVEPEPEGPPPGVGDPEDDCPF